MADPRNRTKATGDTHLPEVEADDFDAERGHPEGTGTEGTQSRGQRGGGDAGRGGRHAGELKDRDNPTSDTDGGTRGPGDAR